MREIENEAMKKKILNYLGFRFSRQREPLSAFRIKVIVYKIGYELDIRDDHIKSWKEVI